MSSITDNPVSDTEVDAAFDVYAAGPEAPINRSVKIKGATPVASEIPLRNP